LADANVFAKHAVSWGSAKYRRSGYYYIVRQEPAGCIVVSEDVKSVYRVLGIGQTLGDLSENIELPRRVWMTILPWCNVLTYDGLMNYKPNAEPLTADTKSRIAAAHAKVVEDDTVIERFDVSEEDRVQFLQELRKAGAVEQADAKADVKNKKCEAKAHKRVRQTDYSKEVKQAISDVKLARKRKGSYWVFRRMGYTERENGGHIVVIVSGAGMMVGMFQTKKLEPTFEEVVTQLSKFGPGLNGFCPETIGIDHKPIVAELQEQLMETTDQASRVVVVYYPPPSAAESSMYGSDVWGS
jgi:hypothetical protein